MSNTPGTLYIVATPIGNLGDWSQRAQESLKKVAVIAAEDTRHSGQLLRQFGITTPLMACHEHNEKVVADTLIQRLQAGEAVALISDAGTPLISDPGYLLVARAHEAGIPVSPIPGPSALITALSVSGLPTDRFVFEGFLPSKQQARRKRLESLCHESRTLVFYEAPHRIHSCLEDMRQVFGDERRALLARELTKTFETVRQDSLAGLEQWVAQDTHQSKGEIVLVVHGAPEQQQSPAETERMLRILLQHVSLKEAAAIAAELSGEKKNALYQQALYIREQENSD